MVMASMPSRRSATSLARLPQPQCLLGLVLSDLGMCLICVMFWGVVKLVLDMCLFSIASSKSAEVEIPSSWEVTTAWTLSFNWNEDKTVLKDPDGINDKRVAKIFQKYKHVFESYISDMRESILLSEGDDKDEEEEEAKVEANPPMPLEDRPP
eukprot:11181182-Lingulodinium_polyedra.AAC.1